LDNCSAIRDRRTFSGGWHHLDEGSRQTLRVRGKVRPRDWDPDSTPGCKEKGASHVFGLEENLARIDQVCSLFACIS
jgi:hypothetical protein